jgi:excisionase family DNA binding protein
MGTSSSTIDPDRAYTVPEAADVLRLSAATVRRLIASGGMGGYRAGHALRTMGADIIAFRRGGGVAASVYTGPSALLDRRRERAARPLSLLRAVGRVGAGGER